MKELTAEIPKPLLSVLGRPVLDHIAASLPDTVDELILVVGYHEDKIRAHCGERFFGRPVRYVTQRELNGTGGALWCAKDLIHGRFIVMNGDDIFRKEDLEACAASPDWALLVLDVEALGSMGKVVVDERGCAIQILEKDAHDGGRGFANTNIFALDPRVFGFELTHNEKNSKEFGLPQTVMQAAKQIPIRVVLAQNIIRLTDPQDIPAAEKKLLETGVITMA